jgi:hypothetical protein
VLSFFDGFPEAIENSTRYITGHVQVRRGFRRELSPFSARAAYPARTAALGGAPRPPRVQAQGSRPAAKSKSHARRMTFAERVTFIDTVEAGRCPWRSASDDRASWRRSCA